MISKCLIYKNESGDSGGGIMSCEGSIVTLINNTIVYNRTKGSGGGIAVNLGGRFIGKNNIIYGNKSQDNFELGIEAVRSDEYVKLTHTCITSDMEIREEGNIYSDPLFVNPGKDDFHLKKNSPCLNAGKKKKNTLINIGAL
jgi:hypothetical protein